MKPILALLALTLAAAATAQQGRTFTSSTGETMSDQLIGFDYEKRMVNLEERGEVPLDAFSKADQDYILRWNMVQGFRSNMRFKTELERNNWARIKHEQTITPYWMDVFLPEGKELPIHLVAMVEDYEEYMAVYLEAEGYSITMANHNFFPLEDITVESKVFYEQEHYVLPDGFFNSMENDYRDTVTTNKVRYRKETLPAIVPREKVVLHSEGAILVDHQIDRSSLESDDSSGDDGSGGDDDGGGSSGDSGGSSGAESIGDLIEGFGDWDDHNRRRKSKLLGCWVRIGMKGPDGEMVWRELTEPSSLPKKVSWDQEPAK